MKKLFWASALALGACVAGDDIERAMFEAVTFERAGDWENAAKAYKKAAVLARKECVSNLNEASTDNSNLNNEKTAQKTDSNLNDKSNLKGEKTQSQETALSSREIKNDGDISLAGIKLHRENYILPASWNSGHAEDNRAFETKFQISAKKALWEGAGGASVNLAYTQTSWWQTAKASAPFRETNYMPEIFTDLPLEKWLANGDFVGLPEILRLGFLHQSNGKGGEESRSWNRLYAQAFWAFGDFSVSPRLWVRVREGEDDNPGIENYAGRGDVELRYNFGRQYVSARIANNLRFSQNRGNVELGYVFPLFDGFYGYVQYFNGYAESMIDYDRHTNRIGVGFLVK